MIPAKTCHYCNKDTAYVPLTVARPGMMARLRIIKVYYCQECQAEYVYWSDINTLSSIHLYTTINGKMYRWSTGTTDTDARLWYIANPGVPGQTHNSGVELLKNFPDHPDLTPQNVQAKIHFMLPYL